MAGPGCARTDRLSASAQMATPVPMTPRVLMVALCLWPASFREHSAAGGLLLLLQRLQVSRQRIDVFGRKRLLHHRWLPLRLRLGGLRDRIRQPRLDVRRRQLRSHFVERSLRIADAGDRMTHLATRRSEQRLPLVDLRLSRESRAGY